MIYLTVTAISLIEKQVVIQTIMTLKAYFLFRLNVPLSLFTTHFPFPSSFTHVFMVSVSFMFLAKATVSRRMYNRGCENLFKTKPLHL